MIVLEDRIAEIIRDLRSYPPNEKGKIFEEFAYKYLKEISSYYSELFKHVWKWNEYPLRGKRHDFGVDIVAEDYMGNRWAIQVKCHDNYINRSDISTFLSALGSNEFQKGMLITTSPLTREAEELASNFVKDVITLTLSEMLEDVDLKKFRFGDIQTYVKPEKKTLRRYQSEAVQNAVKYFKERDRGKLIMAPGTGKTFISLKIAEEMVGKGGYVLFLCPSIALLDQTLREWEREASVPLRAFAVVSDKHVGRVSRDSFERLSILHIPPTTSAEELLEGLKEDTPDKMTVIFSTYQSIEVVSEAQKKGLREFDLIICDEAHRTTGFQKFEGGRKKISPFHMVHKDEYVKGKKRLYMTATPRYFDLKKTNTDELEIEYYSMDDPEIYGETIYEYTFRRAVDEGHLSDYKVIIFELNQRELIKLFYEYLKSEKSLSQDMAFKVFGIWKVINEGVRGLTDEIKDLEISKAILFTSSIAESKAIEREFHKVINEYLKTETGEQIKKIEIRHIDGTMSATQRRELLSWLREGTPEKIHMLTNAKVLTEGIDVPSLDAVIFTKPKESVVEIVQAVGRVMRKAQGKKYGYILIPVLIDPEKPESEQIEKTDYRTIWQIVNALRAVDETFEAKFRIILRSSDKKISLRREKPEPYPIIFDLPPDLKKALFGRIARTLGLTKKYLENWGKEVAKVAEHMTRYIETGFSKDPKLRNMIEELHQILKEFVNESVQLQDVLSMVVQHVLTVPIFDALFEEYDFLKNNPIAKALEKITDYLKSYLERETKELERFYNSVRIRATGIDKEEERQDFLRMLYDSFFRIAFDKTAEKLGIVYTPVEVVDFIIKSVDYILKTRFDSSLDKDGVVILEPFAGTGTFLVRLIEHLPPDSVKEKFARSEIWGNEILLLPYYISKVNVESAYYDKTGEYKPFKTMLLVDSFEMMEKIYEDEKYPSGGLFPEEYSYLLNAEKNAKINVIISNPPWFAYQSSENRAIQRAEYKHLREKIRKDFSETSQTQLRNSLYDSYILAIRMALDRIGDKGIVAFVTNNGWLDGNAMDGMRKWLHKELYEIFIVNLRGNARTKGEARKKEGGGIFGGGSRAGVCIAIFVKDKSRQSSGAKIYYHDIGDYLSREQKLNKLKEFEHIGNVPLIEIEPNELGDWINQRSMEFYKYTLIGSKKQREAIFEIYSRGVVTGRDPWAYNFSRKRLEENMRRMIDEYNRHAELVRQEVITKGNVKQRRNNDASVIKWDGTLESELLKGRKHKFEEAGQIYEAFYRPFVKSYLYFSKVFNNSTYLLPQIFPTPESENLVICVSHKSQNFDIILVDRIYDIHIIATIQGFPLYKYSVPRSATLFDDEFKKEYNITTWAMRQFYERYGEVSEEDIFYYVFGVLNSPDYVERFSNELRKDLPRIPFVKTQELFELFRDTGKKIAELMLNYETIKPYPVEIDIKGDPDKEETYYIEEMKYDELEKGIFRINDNIVVSGIPKEVLRYTVDGKHPLRWIAEYYKHKIDKNTKIEWDPNDWLKEKGNLRYFVELVPRLVTLSIEIPRLREQLKGKLLISE